VTVADIGPNWAILKQPMNWAFIAFVMLLLVFTAYLASKAFNKGSE
jgi:hypothetical protein